ncbi:MAG: staygreen family protein [Anaerolineae bacterium]|nr:staygreen family protein [Anaerolineae bacterium]
MGRLRPEKVHVRFTQGTTPDGPVTPRRYTLTHSDATGDLFLTVGVDYDREQISGLYTRLMRDEVLAEWRQGENGLSLHLMCHVSGGLVLGSARFRYRIFRHELPLVMEAFLYGDRQLFEAHPGLDQASIYVHFLSTRKRYNRVEEWGNMTKYRL